VILERVSSSDQSNARSLLPIRDGELMILRAFLRTFRTFARTV
jgi:hypothetical protein